MTFSCVPLFYSSLKLFTVMILVIHTSEKKLWQHDTSLSLQAKGLMLVLTTCFENNSEINEENLLSHFTNSRDAMHTAREMLRLHDYFRYTRVRVKGRVITTIWEVFDEPSSERLEVQPAIIIGQSTLKL